MSKRILTIQDFSSMGKCSVTAALPILTAMGQDTVALPTALLSTQTYGIEGFTFVDLASNILPSFSHWESLGITFDYLYTGFLGSMESLNATIEIAKKVKQSGGYVAVDPAMAEDGKLYKIFNQEYFERMKDLCKIADLVMPNFTEGVMLAGFNEMCEPSKENSTMILQVLDNTICHRIVMSGVFSENLCGVATLHHEKVTFQMAEAIPGNWHSAGDVLSSAIMSALMSGRHLRDSASIAVMFTQRAICQAYQDKMDVRFGLPFEKFLPNLKKDIEEFKS